MDLTIQQGICIVGRRRSNNLAHPSGWRLTPQCRPRAIRKNVSCVCGPVIANRVEEKDSAMAPVFGS